MSDFRDFKLPHELGLRYLAVNGVPNEDSRLIIDLLDSFQSGRLRARLGSARVEIGINPIVIKVPLLPSVTSFISQSEEADRNADEQLARLIEWYLISTPDDSVYEDESDLEDLSSCCYYPLKVTEYGFLCFGCFTRFDRAGTPFGEIGQCISCGGTKIDDEGICQECPM